MSNGGQPSMPRIGPTPNPAATPPPIPIPAPPPIPKAVTSPSKPLPPKPPPPRIAKPQLPPIAAEPPSQVQRGRPGMMMAKAKRLTHWEVLFRVGVVVVMLGSVAFPWWTYSERLIPLQKQSRDLTTANSGLSAEVDKMDRKWSKQETELIRANYNEAYSSLFPTPEAVEDWLHQLQDRAVPLGLEVSFDFGNRTPQLNDEKLTILPAEIKLQVQPLPNAKDSPYQRLLRLVQQLSAEGKRADLAELDVVGGTGSITNAVLIFNLWLGEPKVQPSPK